MTTTPYIEINGLILTPSAAGPEGLHVTHSGCVTPSGGALKIDEYNYPWRNYATALHGGRQLRKYRVEVASFTRSDIDEFCDYVNNAPIDSEFYPESSDRCCYIQSAHAITTKPALASHPVTGAWTWHYKAEAEIVVRGAWMYGPDQGLPLTVDVDLWAGQAFTNNGVLPAGLDYLLASGDYQSAQYVTNFGVRTWIDSIFELQGDLTLCSKLMRNDRIEFNRWGEVNHQYETDFPMTYSDLQIDLQGATYMDYGSGGSIAHEALHLGTNGKILMPFWGPLPVAENPYVELWCNYIAGTPVVQCATQSDLSDLAGWSASLHLGYNKVYIPYMVGETNTFFGITTNVSSAITINRIKGYVKRYIAPSSIYLVDPGETFTINITGGGGLKLKQLEYYYRDIFYY
jgi:hypothetical protein